MFRYIRACALASLLIAVMGSARAEDVIEIGAIGPFTGGSAPMGVSMLNGIKLAVEEINRDGGVLGRRIALIERDDQANNDLGAKTGEELTVTHPVVAAVGFVNTGVALAALPYFEEARIPLIISVSTGSLLTKQFAPPEYRENYIFRMSASTSIEVEKIVGQVIAGSYTRIAIFADTTSYGQVGRDDLVRALAEHGIKPVSIEKFNIGDTDMTEQLGRARAVGADVILTYGIGPELAGIANSRAKLGWPVPLIGSWTLSMVNFIDVAGPNGEGAITPQTFIEAGDTPRRAAFIAAYYKAYHTSRMRSPPSAAQGYDSMYLLAAAIRQAGSTDGPKIREALEHLDARIDGVVTTYDHPFDATDHEAIALDDVVMGVVRSGRVVRLIPNTH